ncbi:helix-turn-helix transcriptional regulator [Nannocystaceae bacterium ST9]
MRRADRLFQIVSLLRRRRFTTAAWLAERLEVSERTIYRDVADLARSGVPVEGEAGVGYRLGKDFDLPPLMFNVEEIRALVLGARMVESWADDDLRQAARSVLDKVEAVLPPSSRGKLQDTALFALGLRLPEQARALLGPLRRAIDERRVLTIEYRDAGDTPSERSILPLALYFWGATWTLAAWCRLRADYRNFRVDRIARAKLEDERFELVSPVTLAEFIEAMNTDD